NMSDLAKEKAARLLKKRGSLSSLGSHDVRTKEPAWKAKDSISTVSYIDEPGHHDDIPRPAMQMENTYQLVSFRNLFMPFCLSVAWEGPTKRFPVLTVQDILKDVLASYLQEEKYEPELCRQMTKTISEVVKARVKDMMIPRYKVIVVISIGQLTDQNMRMGSRCLWDAASDTFSSHTFKNSSLFAVANVYGVYFE
ncbi:hypothetical protein P4O66_017167, partial [Electrophorus voltai]